MPSRECFIRWRLLGASGSPSRTLFKKRAGWSTFESPLPTSQRGSITRFGRWQIAVPVCALISQRPRTSSSASSTRWKQPGGDSKNDIRVLSSGNHRRGKRARINNPPRGDPRRPPWRLSRNFARLQAQVDQRARAKRTWGLDQSSGATFGALYIGWNPTRGRLPLFGYQQDPCCSGRAQKAEVRARRPNLRAKLIGP